jgi:O-acetylserine/cysteine efflux transporter
MSAIPLTHIALLLLMVLIWGSNFVVIKWTLEAFPPFTMAAFRFFIAALPWVLLVKRPPVSWAFLLGFGLVSGPGQFGLIYLAMRSDLSPGLASVIVQSQVFFTIGLSAGLFGERVSSRSLIGLILASAGLIVIGLRAGGDATPFGVLLAVISALFWALGNVMVKSAAKQHPRDLDTLALTIWSSAFAAPLLLALAMAVEGDQVWRAASSASVGSWGGVAWQAVASTLLGYGIWNWLLTRHTAQRVTPFALLVPIVGMASSALAVGELMPAWKLAAGALVVAGLSVHFLGTAAPRR